MKSWDNLKALGSKVTHYKFTTPTLADLETFENPNMGNDYEIVLETDEFTSLCPKTRAPDYGKIHIRYTPDQKCIETKSLKLYLFSYRNHGSFMEAIVNKIIHDLGVVCEPKKMTVIGTFKSRGGIEVSVKATITKD